MKISEKTATPSGAGIETIETGMALLMVLAELGRPQMLKTIAERAGMPASKAHRYLVSFTRSGFVARDADTGRYKLGPMSIEVGLAALANTDAVRLATQIAVELRDVFDSTTSVSVWGSHGPTIVRIEDSIRPEINARAGTVIPLLSSSSGRVFAAFLPERFVDPILRRELSFNARRKDDRLVSSAEAAQKILNEVQRRGMGRVIGEMTPGVHALAAPLLDHRGYPAAVVAVMGAGEAFDSAWNGDIARRMRDMTAKASRELGYLPELAAGISSGGSTRTAAVRPQGIQRSHSRATT